MRTDANARGAQPTLGHIRGLDGIRALSVRAIIAFHTGPNSVPGGFSGVDSFFVLSRFLITSLLGRPRPGSCRRAASWATPSRPSSTSRTGSPSMGGVTSFSLSAQPSPLLH